MVVAVCVELVRVEVVCVDVVAVKVTVTVAVLGCGMHTNDAG